MASSFIFPLIFVCIGFLLLGLISLLGSDGRKLVADARWAGRIEKINAMTKAISQSKNCKPGNTSLFLGKVPKRFWLTKLEILLTGSSSSVPFANMQGSALVFGSPDVGKSTTCNNNFIRHILRNGLGAMAVFDPKGDLVAANAPYAEACGYECFYLAPGKKYTDSINIFDFFKGREDMLATVAQQAAITTIRNTKSEDAGKSDSFFGPSGEALVRSSLMLTYNSPHQDLVMLKELLCADDLASRIGEAERQKEISWQIASSFRQFISGKSSDKTLGGIQATASLVFDSFVREEFFNAFVRKSTIPLDLSGKKIIFIQPMRGFEDVCMPVISTILELLIERNFAEPRQEPLFTLIDEAHLAYLPSLAKWLAYLRSSGLVMVLLTQALSQLRQKYGQNNLNTILTSARTKIFMNPDDLETAKFVSEKVGKRDKFYKQHSRSSGKGGRNVSNQRQQVPLITPQKINSMKQGEMVYWNSANANKDEDGLPVKTKYIVPQSDLDLEANCKKFWEERMRERVIKERYPQHMTSEEMAQFVTERVNAIDSLYPLPIEEEEESPDVDPLFKKDFQTKGIVRNDIDAILPKG